MQSFLVQPKDAGRTEDTTVTTEPTQDASRADGELVVYAANAKRMADEIRTMLDEKPNGSQSMADRLRANFDAGKINKMMMKRYGPYVEKMRKNSPRILLVGDSGAGKSSTVNIVFGLRAGDGGANVRAGGRPCTKHFAEYGPTDRAPVRIVDSKGTEKLKSGEQVEELRKYVEAASASPDESNHVHLCWYFVGEKWQDADKILVQELMKTCGVTIVLSKRDQRTGEWVRNTRDAIEADLGTVGIAEVGDPRGTRNWIPESCENGHSDDYFSVKMRLKRWTCEFSVGIDTESGEERLCMCRGDDSPFGHPELVRMSLDLLPIFVRHSFLAAQRVDLSRKHVKAAAIVGSCAAGAAGIGLWAPLILDLAGLVALEVSMAILLVALYGVPPNILYAEGVDVFHGCRIGTGTTIGYVGTQLLKLFPSLMLVGATIDMMAAAVTTATLGIAMSVVLTKCLTAPDTCASEAQRMIKTVADRISPADVLKAVSARVVSSSRSDHVIVGLIKEQCTAQRLRDL